MMLKRCKWYGGVNVKRQKKTEWKNARILIASSKWTEEKKTEELCNFAN